MPKNTKTKTRPAKKENNISVFDIFKFGESYTSLILGIVVVVIATIILLTFVKGKNAVNKPEFAKEVKQEEIIDSPTQTKNLLTNEQKNASIASSKIEPKPTQITKNKNTVIGSIYTVAQGDTLWNIAEKKYNSGYNWVDIQKANKITNPDILIIGTKLRLPNVEPKIVTVINTNTTKGGLQTGSTIQTNKIIGSSYTVTKGDTLWDISVRAYGDGYAWTKISQANKLSNPNLIHPGNKLIIPRK